MMFLATHGKSAPSTTAGGEKKSSSDPIELGKEWKRNLAKEVRNIDRDIAKIKREEDKAIKECKALAKKGRTDAVKILAKQIVETRKTVERMHTAKAQLNSVSNHLQTTMSIMKMQGVITKSAEIMGTMNKLVSVKEISQTMNNMAREMERSGLIDEIVGDALDSMDSEGLDAAADLEVDRIVSEITAGILAPASSAPIGKPQSSAAVVMEDAKPSADETDAATDDLLSRLQAL
eukprot:gene12047-16121_t